MIRKIFKKFRTPPQKNEPEVKSKRELLMQKFFDEGKIPWSPGYEFYKRDAIIDGISNETLLSGIQQKKLPNGFGHRLDERVVEYSWIFSNLPETSLKMLDAGSTFNFSYIVNHPNVKNKELSIFTYAPEEESFNKERISYVYGDLRDMLFKENYFDLVVSQSTIEHIDMDNSMYGYSLEHNKETDKKSYEYLKAVAEMLRVLSSKGTLMLTVPFGKFENHGFFQQFDKEMINRIYGLFENQGAIETSFFKYEKDGWRFATVDELSLVESFNPHTGKGKKDDGAAHSRAIACIRFIKN